MTEQEAELVRRGFERLREAGVEGLLAFIHPEFEVTTPASLAAEPDTYRGREGIRRYFDSFGDAMEDVRFEGHRFEDLGEGRVLVPFTLSARGRATGIEVEQQAVQIWELRDGLAYRLSLFPSEREALASLEPT